MNFDTKYTRHFDKKFKVFHEMFLDFFSLFIYDNGFEEIQFKFSEMSKP